MEMEGHMTSLEELQQAESTLRSQILDVAGSIVESFSAYLPDASTTPFAFPVPQTPNPSELDFPEQVGALQAAQSLVQYCNQLNATVHDLDQELQSLRRHAKNAGQGALGDNHLVEVTTGLSTIRSKFFYASQLHASTIAYANDPAQEQSTRYLPSDVAAAVRDTVGSTTIAYRGCAARFRSVTILAVGEALKAFGWPPAADGKSSKSCFEPISQLHGQALSYLGAILREAAWNQATHAAATADDPTAGLQFLSTGGPAALEELLKPQWRQAAQDEGVESAARRVSVREEEEEEEGGGGGGAKPSLGTSARRPWLWTCEALCSGLEERLMYHCGLKDLPGGNLGPVADAKGPAGLATQMWLMFTYLARCLDVLTPQLEALEVYLQDLGLTSQGLLRWGLTRALSRLARSMLEGYMLPTLHSFQSYHDQRAAWVSLVCMASDFERRVFWCGPMPLITPNTMSTLSMQHPTGSIALDMLGGLPVPPGGLDVSAFPTTLGLDHLDEKNDPEGLSALFQDGSFGWFEAWRASTVLAIQSVLSSERLPPIDIGSTESNGMEGHVSSMQEVADALQDGPSLVEKLIAILRCSLSGLHGVGMGTHTRAKAVAAVINSVSDELHGWLKRECESMEVHDNIVAPVFLRRASLITKIAALISGSLRDWGAGEGLIVDYSAAADRLEALCGRLDRLRRRWALKISSHASRNLHTALKGYLSQVQDRYRCLQHPMTSIEASHTLEKALTWLRTTMTTCKPLMDRKSFAECWRAVANYLNRILFNNIATEVIFTATGAQRFSADLGLVFSTFRAIATRAEFFFDESLSASILLQLNLETAQSLLQELDACVDISEDNETARTAFVLHKAPKELVHQDQNDPSVKLKARVRERVQRVMNSYNVGLTLEQACCVLCQREDIV